MAMSSLEMATDASISTIVKAGTIGIDEAPLADKLRIVHASSMPKCSLAFWPASFEWPVERPQH